MIFERTVEGLKSGRQRQAEREASIQATWNGCCRRESSSDDLRLRISAATLAIQTDRIELTNIEKRISELVVGRTAATSLETSLGGTYHRATCRRSCSSPPSGAEIVTTLTSKRIERNGPTFPPNRSRWRGLRAPDKKDHAEFQRLSTEQDRMRLETGSRRFACASNSSTRSAMSCPIQRQALSDEF